MKKRTLVVLLLVFHTSLFSQSPASIEELIPKLQSANDSEKIDLYGHISFLYMSRDRFDSAIYYMNLSLPISQKLGDPKKIGNAYNNLGTIYRMSGENERAMENLVKALTIFEKNNFNKQSSKALGNISYIYTQQQNYNEAVKTLLQAAQKSEAAKKEIAARLVGGDFCGVPPIQFVKLIMHGKLKEGSLQKFVPNDGTVSTYLEERRKISAKTQDYTSERKLWRLQKAENEVFFEFCDKCFSIFRIFPRN